MYREKKNTTKKDISANSLNKHTNMLPMNFPLPTPHPLILNTNCCEVIACKLILIAYLIRVSLKFFICWKLHVFIGMFILISSINSSSNLDGV